MVKIDRVRKPLKKTGTRKGKGGADLKDDKGTVDFTGQARRRRARAKARAADKQPPKPAPAPKIESSDAYRDDIEARVRKSFEKRAKRIAAEEGERPKLTLEDLNLDPDAVEGENAEELNPGDDAGKAREERRKATKALLERLGGDAE